MTTLRVDGQAIAALGADLLALSQVLESLGRLGPRSVGDLGHAEVARALDELLGNWTLMRRQVAEALGDLGEAAEQAGTAYLVVERGVLESFASRPDNP